MTNRKQSQIAGVYMAATAVTATCLVLYSLMAGLPLSETLVLLLGVLIVVWAIIFTFLEVRRIAARAKSIAGSDELVDPDAPRRVIVEGPTGEATPHHEAHAGSPGLDQGQLTSNLPDHTPNIGNLMRFGRRKSSES
jgi:hypothetical protein